MAHSAAQLLQQGLALHDQGRVSEAAAIYRRVIAHDPRNAEALHLLGVTELQLSNPGAAAELITQAAAIDRRNALYLSNLGLALSQLGRFDDALARFDQSLAIQANSANTQSHRGNVLRSLGRRDQALAAYARALAINPSHADALNNRGAVLGDLNRASEALASFDRALAANADHAGALANRGALLVRLNRFDEAVPDLDRAHGLDARNAVVLNNRGNAFAGMKRHDAALADFGRALSVDPQYADAWFNRATVLFELRRFGEAVVSVEHCLAIAPGHVEALVNRAHLQSELGRPEPALADYEQAIAIAPGQELLPGWRSFCKLKLCDWRDLSGQIASIGDAVRRGEPACSPAILLAMSGDPALLRQCAETHAQKYFPGGRNILPGQSANGRIRLGYFSADFHDHATAWLTAGLFEHHDKSRFEVFAFSFGPPAQDSMRRRLVPCFERFLEIGQMSDAEAARLARDMDLDIAVDMKGFTEGSRPHIFAERVAPIQASYLGYPGTVGASYMDYIIADRHVLPEPDECFYAEKIAWLPGSYQPNDSLHDSGAFTPARSQYGLPEQEFVFCCFNNSYKITPQIFAIWMRLLAQTPDSVLWLFEDNPQAAKNLRAQAQTRGIDSGRLIFAGRASHDEHLARQRLADLFLDTLPYGAHTTASDALRAGLPLLTCTGTAFQGRVATSLLHAVGMPELITGTLEEYEAVALRIAQNPEKQRGLRKKLVANLPQTALFDTATYTRNLETAFEVMWEKHRQGLPPASFRVGTKSFAGSPTQS